MAEDRSGLKKDYLRELAPWTKLFSAFKVAMDPKKLLLAGGGIFVMALGWWFFAAVFCGSNQKAPMPKVFLDGASDYGGEEKAFQASKEARRSWNLSYEMAGEHPATRAEADALLKKGEI